MTTKAKAVKAAEHALGPNSLAIVFGAFVRGYMAGHAASIRSGNKRILPFHTKAIEELRIVEREIGIPSEALKLIQCSSLNGDGKHG